MIRNRILPVILFLFTLAVNGQVSVGNRIGVSIFKQTIHADDPDVQNYYTRNMVSSPGISLAIPIEIQLSNNFALQPEVGYMMKGMIRDHYYWEDSRLNYADFTLLGKLMIERSRWRAELFAGPGISYGISLRYIREQFGDPQNRDDLLPWRYNNYRNTEIHITAGAGISYAIGAPRLFFNYRYMHGISQLLEQQQISFYDPGGMPTIVEISGYNRGHIVSLGIMVPLSRDAWARVGGSAPQAD